MAQSSAVLHGITFDLLFLGQKPVILVPVQTQRLQEKMVLQIKQEE
jgi:hypothetical protein